MWPFDWSGFVALWIIGAIVLGLILQVLREQPSRARLRAIEWLFPLRGRWPRALLIAFVLFGLVPAVGCSGGAFLLTAFTFVCWDMPAPGSLGERSFAFTAIFTIPCGAILGTGLVLSLSLFSLGNRRLASVPGLIAFGVVVAALAYLDRQLNDFLFAGFHLQGEGSLGAPLIWANLLLLWSLWLLHGARQQPPPAIQS